MTPRRASADEVVENAEDSSDAVELKPEVSPDAADSDMHPLSRKLLQSVPFLGDLPVLGSVLKAYSPRLVSSVCLERTFAKGLANGFMNFSIQPMLIAHFQISGAMCQRIAPLYPLGWSLNSFFTVVTDTFALLGYTKRWFCVLSTLAGGVFALLYAMLPGRPTSVERAGTYMFLTAVFIANVDTSSTALYGRIIKSKPACGAAMVSWALVADILGTMIAAFTQGPLSDNYMPFIGVYITSGTMFMLTLMFVFNSFGEQPNRVCRVEDAKSAYAAQKKAQRELQQQQEEAARRDVTDPYNSSQEISLINNTEPTNELEDDEEEEEPDTDKDEVGSEGFVAPEVPSVLWGTVELNLEVVKRSWLMIVFSCVLTAAVVTTATVVIVGSHWDVLYMSIAITLGICAAAFLTLPLPVAKVMIFVFLKNTTYLYMPGVLKTFYLAKPVCLPHGPHFSFTFFNIMNGVVGNLSGVIAVAVLAKYLQPFTYRGIMCAAAFLIPLISLFDFIILKRWNMYFGLPDHVVFVLGNTICFEAINTVLNTPTMLLMSRLAPRGSESMALALMAGVANLGSSLSAAYAHVLLETIWPIQVHGTCEYGNAPWLVVAGHFCTPALLIPLAFLLLPYSRLSAAIDENGEEK